MYRIAGLFVFMLVFGCAPTGPSTADMALSHYQLAQSYMVTRDFSSALKELLEGVRLQPDNPQMHNLLAQAYQRKGALPQAEQHYRQALKLQPDNPDYQNNLAALYLDMQRWSDAATYFRKAADNLLFKYPVRALTGLGVAYYYAGDYVQAVIAYKDALKQFPDNLNVLHLLGKCYEKMGKYDMSEEVLERAMEIDPQNNAMRMDYAKILLKQRKNERAQEQFREIANREDKSELGREARDYLKLFNG